MVMNNILDIYRDVDLIVRPRVDGFVMAFGIDGRLARIDSPSEERNRIYSQIEEQRITTVRTALDSAIGQYTAARREQQAFPNFWTRFTSSLTVQSYTRECNPKLRIPQLQARKHGSKT
jgi:hypothetical protein